MARYCVIGSRGFLGSALAKRLGDYDYFPKKDTEVIFHFDSPVHPHYEENPDYWFHKVMNDFLYLLPYCQEHNIRFVYPSSALVYEKQQTDFIKQKKILEMMASMYPNTLGLRIFPVYGPGESRTVVSQWCKEMKQGKSPIVYGSGKQKRSFIYIDDAIDQIIRLADERKTGVADIGVKDSTRFLEIVDIINNILRTEIRPTFVKLPEDYPNGVNCPNPMSSNLTMREGIRKVLESGS